MWAAASGLLTNPETLQPKRSVCLTGKLQLTLRFISSDTGCLFFRPHNSFAPDNNIHTVRKQQASLLIYSVLQLNFTAFFPPFLLQNVLNVFNMWYQDHKASKVGWSCNASCNTTGSLCRYKELTVQSFTLLYTNKIVMNIIFHLRPRSPINPSHWTFKCTSINHNRVVHFSIKAFVLRP